MSVLIFWIFALLIILPSLKAFLCTLLFRWNDRRNLTDKYSILTRIADKIENETKNKDLSVKVLDVIKSYLFSYVTIYSYYSAYIPSQSLRKFIYRRILGCSIGKNSSIHFGVKMLMPHRISIGDNCIVGESSFLDGRMFIEMGNNINLSTGVTIWTLQHDPYSSSFGIVGCAVHIEDNAWISFRSTVLPGVTVKKNCVIGAHSVVTKTTNEAGIYFGVPAKEVKKRDIEINYKLAPMGFFY